jgi:hypothetical protein
MVQRYAGPHCRRERRAGALCGRIYGSGHRAGRFRSTDIGAPSEPPGSSCRKKPSQDLTDMEVLTAQHAGPGMAFRWPSRRGGAGTEGRD